MWGFPSVESKPSVDSCRQAAENLYRDWDEAGARPISWSLIDNDEAKLVRVFQFLCEMRQLQEVVPQKLNDHLTERLKGRFDSNDRLPVTSDLEAEIKVLSTAQVSEFARLKELVEPAFELFVTASLVSHRRLYMTADLSKLSASHVLKKLIKREPGPGDFEPNGSAFFLWAEFGLVALQLNFNAEAWRKVLPILFRCERILALCWGGSNLGFIPSERVMEFYDGSSFIAIHPCQARSVPKTSATTWDELDAEATQSRRFAFPGNFANARNEVG